jgi:hypothetical protein
MKRLIMLSTILFFTSILIHVNALGTNRIFLLDTSQSMKRAGLFDRIKEALKNDYVSSMKDGEHIIVLTFDENIAISVDQSITGENDIKEANERINSLKAAGRWTWMTRAFQTTMEQAKRLKTQYPEDALFIYLLTDGINDPPPTSNEPPLAFPAVISKYFKDIKIDNAHVYLFVYRDEEEIPSDIIEVEKNIEKSTKGIVEMTTIAPTWPDPIPPEIHVGHAGFDFGVVNLSKGEVAETGSIGIKELKGDAKSRIVQLSCETESFSPIISELTPRSFKVMKEGQIEKIVLHIPIDLSSGEYVAALKLSSNGALITPNEIPVRFVVEVGKEPSNWAWAWIWNVLIVILILAVAYFLLLISRQKRLWLQKEGQGNREPIKIKGLRKDSLKKVGLPNYDLGLSVYPQEIFSVFLFKNKNKEGKITMGESIKCQDPQGKDIIIIFHDKPSVIQPEGPTQETEKKEEDPDFFKKKDDKIIDFLLDEHKGDIK